jgi:hypothetical protein
MNIDAKQVYDEFGKLLDRMAPGWRDPVEPPAPPPPTPPVSLKPTKIYESPKGLKISALREVQQGMLVCEYNTKTRERSVVRLLQNWKHPIHDGREETIQAPIVFGNELIFPTERHKTGLIVLDRSTLKKVKGLTPKHEICIAGGLWQGRVVVASSRFPIGNAVIQDALSGETLRIMPMLGVVSALVGEWCIVRSDAGDGAHCVTNWVDGERHDIPATAIAEWRGALYVGTGKGQLYALYGAATGFVQVANLGMPIYSLHATTLTMWLTTKNPNKLWSMGPDNVPQSVQTGQQASLGWFGLPIEADSQSRICWAEWDPKRELSIVWRLG